jgi:hypothetical protein
MLTPSAAFEPGHSVEGLSSDQQAHVEEFKNFKETHVPKSLMSDVAWKSTSVTFTNVVKVA